MTQNPFDESKTRAAIEPNPKRDNSFSSPKIMIATAVAVVALALAGFMLFFSRTDAQQQSAATSRLVPGGVDEHAEGEQHVEGEVEGAPAGIALTPQQRATAEIAVETLAPSPLPRVIRAQGEVKSNDYSSYLVSPRVTATVVARHARLGDRVRRGQRLVTMFSVDVAEAQSSLVLAEQEYARMERIGREIVAGQQYDAAAVKRQEARGRLESFGIAPDQVAALAETGLIAGRSGQFDLVAAADGIVTQDDFRNGEVVETGKTLFEITDPTVVWVEAQVSPELAADIDGTSGKITAGGVVRQGRILQVRDVLNEATRTIGVRLEIDNADRQLKPGQFVDVELYGQAQPVLALPTAAVTRGADGDWTIFVEDAAGRFVPREVEVLYSVGEMTAISGVPAGTKVVTKGAFFIMSEAAKAGFDAHAH